MIDLISILIGIVIGSTCGVLIALTGLEEAKNELIRNYKVYLEKRGITDVIHISYYWDDKRHN